MNMPQVSRERERHNEYKMHWARGRGAAALATVHCSPPHKPAPPPLPQPTPLQPHSNCRGSACTTGALPHTETGRELCISTNVGTSASCCRWRAKPRRLTTDVNLCVPVGYSSNSSVCFFISLFFLHNHQSQTDAQNICEKRDEQRSIAASILQGRWPLHAEHAGRWYAPNLCECILISSLPPINPVAIVRGGDALGSSPKQQATKWIDGVKNWFKCFLATRCISVLKAVIPSRWLFKVPHCMGADVRRQKATFSERQSVHQAD